jgi:hypothetical protein
VRYDEIAAGAIQHAVRFTASRTQGSFVWPARHEASSISDPGVPPMGQRFRLKASFDVSTFSPPVRVLLNAFKTYGLILADNGSNWYISGTHDERWADGQIEEMMVEELRQVSGSAFEAVDISGLMLDADSGQVRTARGEHQGWLPLVAQENSE